MFTFPETVTARPVGGRLVIMDLEGNSYYSLNETARFMLESLLKLPSRSEVLDAVTEEFAVDRGEAESDLNGLIADLMGRHLLEEFP